MDNQNKPNSPNHQNKELYLKLKDSPYKHQNKDNNFLNQASPNKSILGFIYTPSKKSDLNKGYAPSSNETPPNINANSPFSPILINQKSEISYHKIPYKSVNELSPFQPLITNPNNNQRISEKK